MISTISRFLITWKSHISNSNPSSQFQTIQAFQLMSRNTNSRWVAQLYIFDNLSLFYRADFNVINLYKNESSLLAVISSVPRAHAKLYMCILHDCFCITTFTAQYRTNGSAISLFLLVLHPNQSYFNQIRQTLFEVKVQSRKYTAFMVRGNTGQQSPTSVWSISIMTYQKQFDF